MPKLVAPTAKPIHLTALHPNEGVEAAYKRKLQDLIAEMSASVIYWTRAAWRKDNPLMAQDATTAISDNHGRVLTHLRKTMTRLSAHWTKRFDDLGPELAKVFVDGATAHTDMAFSASLAKAGFSVKFKPTPGSMEAFQAVLHENVGLIKSIPAQYLQSVEGDVWRCVSGGYDLKTLTDTLQDRYGVTHRRAALISRDQSSKASAIIENTRRKELGITQAIWQHSGGGHVPRPLHVKAGRDKLVFDLDKGAYIDGKWILPGTEINCRCTSRAIVPGFED